MTKNESQLQASVMGPSWCRFLLLVLTITSIATNSIQAAKVISYKNHRMGEISLAQTQQQQLDLLEPTGSPTVATTTTIPTTTAATSTATTTTTSQPDIIINSIEDELAGKWTNDQAGQLSNRHRYEQPMVGSGQTTTDTTGGGQQQHQVAIGRLDGDQQQAELQAAKIEARNQQEGSLEQQQQQQESLIVDHRPSGGAQMLNENQQSTNEYTSSTQTPPVYSSTAPSSSSATSTTTASSMSSYPSQQSAISGGTQMVPQWLASSTSPNGQQQQFYFASQVQPSTGSNANQQQQQQQQQFGSMAGASNQMVTVQHPTSINSIISEQQQQSTGNSLGASSPAQAQMMATVNGQPTSLILVNQPPAGGSSAGSATTLNGMPQQIIGIGQNGRRVSISNWLRGIGSMLANIFNRREHGSANGLQPAMMASNANGIAVLAPPTAAAAPSASNNWIQLGPNAPHWLTQAQSAIQQFQQQHHQLGVGSSRFATFIQAPQQQQQQQQQVSLAPQMSQQQANNFQQLSGDLQTSGSSHNIVSVLSPSGGPLATNQPYPGGTIVFTQLGGQALSPAQAQTQQQAPAKQQQQQQQQQQQLQQQAHQTGQTQAQPQSRPSSNQSGENQSAASVRNQQPVSGASTIHAARLGRSSYNPNTSNIKSQRLGSQNNGGNLPLAHYSQYAASDH